MEQFDKEPISLPVVSKEKLLEDFADASDKLLQLGIITTDSFTGEIGEYIACTLFNLKKSKRVNEAVDGVSITGERYQIKAKIGNINYTINNLQPSKFDYLVVVYFNKHYKPTRILRIPASKINSDKIAITASNISNYQEIDLTNFKIPFEQKEAIASFGIIYNQLLDSGTIRSRRIVGDIGEYYACERLNLKVTESCTQKGYDAKHSNGLTFEIKTRRVYDSARRDSETRRLNNLVGKSADYLIVVTLDRIYKCSGMWLIPMARIENKKSANLYIVNNTPGTLNLVPSQVSYLKTGKRFTTFDNLKHFSKNSNKHPSQKSIKKSKAIEELKITELNSIPIPRRNNLPYYSRPQNKSLWGKIIKSVKKHDESGGCITIIMLLLLLLYLLGFLL